MSYGISFVLFIWQALVGFGISPLGAEPVADRSEIASGHSWFGDEAVIFYLCLLLGTKAPHHRKMPVLHQWGGILAWRLPDGGKQEHGLMCLVSLCSSVDPIKFSVSLVKIWMFGLWQFSSCLPSVPRGSICSSWLVWSWLWYLMRCIYFGITAADLSSLTHDSPRNVLAELGVAFLMSTF